MNSLQPLIKTNSIKLPKIHMSFKKILPSASKKRLFSEKITPMIYPVSNILLKAQKSIYHILIIMASHLIYKGAAAYSKLKMFPKCKLLIRRHPPNMKKVRLF